MHCKNDRALLDGNNDGVLLQHIYSLCLWDERAVLLESLETSQPVFHYLGGCEAQADRRLQL